jgi:ABC-type dipeptide/oligopeptide/nickel transport system permease subunit
MDKHTDAALQRASQHIQTGEHATATKIIREVLREGRDNAQAWYLLSFALSRPEDQQRAIREAYKLAPDNPRIQNRLSELRSAIQEAPNGQTLQSIALAPTEEYKQRSKMRRFNGPLFLGIALIGLIFATAYFGPAFAPRDPMEQHNIIQIEGQWYTPPIEVLTPTFPLGSDEFGRDVLSRLIFAIRPTLEMVLLVATTRLLLGTLIGLIAGWSRGAFGNFFDSLISAALAIPVLIVALGGIAAVGIELGVIAFVIALSITGWVETARIVRDQTETIRGQQYIEAAFAMGSPTLTMIHKHVFPQIMSIIWILFAFELSGTLMVTAALGFLGYYIGGDIWTPGAQDRVARAISGMPELGQMLATAGGRITQPWGLIAVGSIVFFTVLGFNLLGEGLRRRYNLLEGRRKTAVGEQVAAFNLWIDEHILYPLGNFWRHPRTQVAVRLILVVAAVGAAGWYWWDNRPRPTLSSPLQSENMPLWTNAARDAYGTRWTAATGPQTGEMAWVFEDTNGFTGSPVVTPQGGLLVASNAGVLYGLAPDGRIIMQLRLDDRPVGSPALGEDLTIYFTHPDGGASAYGQNGALLWRYAPENSNAATSGPVLGPDGSLYYVVGSSIRSVSADGALRWSTQALNGSAQTPVILTPDGENVVIWNSVLSAATGEIVDQSANEIRNGYFSGSNGEFYIWDNMSEIYPWSLGNGQLPEPVYTWEEAANFTLSGPNSAGTLPDNTLWLFYDTFSPTFGMGTDTRVVWINENNRVINNINYPTRGSQVIGVDQGGTLYACGNLDRGYGQANCQAFDPDQDEPRWTFTLPRGQAVVGGAVVPGRAYVITQEGFLYALGAADELGELDIHAISLANDTTNSDESDHAFMADYVGPTSPDVSWELILDTGQNLTAGPVDAGDGSFYITMGNFLAHYDQTGALLNQFEFEHPPVGGLTLSADNTVYLVNKVSHIRGFKDDEQVFAFDQLEGYEGRSGVSIDSQGNFYFIASRGGNNFLQKVSPDGQALWIAELDTFSVAEPPELTTNGNYLFVNDEIYAAEDGARLEYDLGFLVQYFTAGQDGRSYLVTDDSVTPVTISPDGLTLGENRLIIHGTPPQVLVQPNGDKLLYYTGGVSLYGFDGHLKGAGTIGAFTPYLAGIEKDMTLYGCGRNRSDARQATRLFCAALKTDEGVVIWGLEIGESGSSNDIETSDAFIHDHAIIVGAESGLIYRIAASESVNDIADGIAGEGETIELLRAENRLTGGALHQDRLLAVNSHDSHVLLIDLETLTYRQFELPERPIGAPAFAQDGSIFVTLSNGDLLKLSLDGKTLWQFTPSVVGGGLHGPRVAPDGSAYYMVQRSNAGIIIAVSDGGVELWNTQVETGKIYTPLTLVNSGQYLFFLNEIYEAHNGARLPVDFTDQIRHFFVGGDGRTYYLSDNSIYEVIISPAGVEITGNGAAIEATSGPYSQSLTSGGVTRDGVVWFATNTPPFQHFYRLDGSAHTSYEPNYTLERWWDADDNPSFVMADGTILQVRGDEWRVIMWGPSAVGPATLVE